MFISDTQGVEGSSSSSTVISGHATEVKLCDPPGLYFPIEHPIHPGVSYFAQKSMAPAPPFERTVEDTVDKMSPSLVSEMSVDPIALSRTCIVRGAHSLMDEGGTCNEFAESAHFPLSATSFKSSSSTQSLLKTSVEQDVHTVDPRIENFPNVQRVHAVEGSRSSSI
jgi:hypothetical protein